MNTFVDPNEYKSSDVFSEIDDTGNMVKYITMFVSLVEEQDFYGVRGS